MMVNGFVANAHDPCLFTRWDKDGPVHVIAHVDDVGCIAKTHQVEEFYKEFYLHPFYLILLSSI